jgi:tripartite-type tricarboxylate transporter receptor subunit TctC
MIVGKLLARAGLAVTLCVLAFGAQAQDFPNQPIRWIVGYAAGGASDNLARVVAAAVEKVLGQPVVVENREGAGGIIAAGLVHESAPDGYTLLMLSNSYFNPVALGATFDFDPKEFEPVSRLAIIPNIAVVPADSPINSIQDLIDAAKADPGKLNYGIGGIGSGTHFSSEIFKTMTGTDIVGVPYGGTPAALIDLIAGRVDVMFAGASPALPHVESGKLKAIAVTSAERTAVLPDVPTVAETLPGFEAVTWYAAFATKGTPPDVLAKLNAAFQEALGSEEVASKLRAQGFDPAPSTSEGLQQILDAHMETTRAAAEKAGITLESLAN